MKRIQQQDSFRNQAKVVPLVIGFSLLALGFLSMVLFESLAIVHPLDFLGLVILGTFVTFVLQQFLWVGNIHPLDTVPRRAVIFLGLFACGFSGYVASAWGQVMLITWDASGLYTIEADLSRWLGWAGACLGAVALILTGLRMSRYAYLRFLVVFHGVALGMVALLACFPMGAYKTLAGDRAVEHLGEVGRSAALVWAAFILWAAPILLYLWKYRKHKQVVAEVEIDPDFI